MKAVFAVLLMMFWTSNALAETRFTFVSKKEVELGQMIMAKIRLMLKSGTAVNLVQD